MTTMSDKGKGPIFDPGLCRCCGSMKRCRLLNTEYQCMGKKEVYSDMFMDCFGLLLSHLDGVPSSRLVCAMCVARLREAAAFRAQVLRCEAAFLQLRMCRDDRDDQLARLEASAKLEVEVKAEPVDYVGEPDDSGDTGDIGDIGDTGDIGDSGDIGDTGEPDDIALPAVERVKVEAAAARDCGAPPARRKRPRSPAPAADRPPKPPVKPCDEEPRMTAEEAAELKKHRTNIKNIIEFSNATPIRCFSGIGYRCCYCTDTYPNPKDLKVHTLSKHNVKARKVLMQRNLLSAFVVRLDVTGLKCQICDETLNTIEDLMKHLMEHEKKVYFDVNSRLIPFKFDDGLKCAVCDKDFTKFRSLQEHMNMHFRNYICDVCEMGYPTKRMLGQHFNMHKLGVFNCEYCHKTFNTDQKRKMHERHVHIYGNSNFLNKCGVCQARFKSYRVKEQHMMDTHGVSSEAKCQACERVFKNQRQLSIHVQRDHLMRRPHKCNVCNMAFFGAQELLNHTVKHTGERRFRCEVCMKAYGRKKTLREHMRIHAADRRFKCEYCGLEFVQKCSWRGHMRAKHSELFAE